MSADVEARLAQAMAAAQAGDKAAYAALLTEAVPVIAATARARGVAADLIDDVVQDVLLTVHRARQTYDPARPFLPWLRAIADRRAIDALRYRGRRSAREIHDPAAYETGADGGVPADRLVEERERARSLAAAIRTLPAGQREAVERLGLQEQSLAEAAVATARSTGALKVNFHRALKSLRARLRVGGGAEPGDVG